MVLPTPPEPQMQTLRSLRMSATFAISAGPAHASAPASCFRAGTSSRGLKMKGSVLIGTLTLRSSR